MSNKIDPKWKAQILKEHRDLTAPENEEEFLHNQDLHKRILTAWRQDSAEMWKELMAAGLTNKLAAVLQERMWTEMDDLMEQGYPVTDAREQAERNNLLMEPESEMP